MSEDWKTDLDTFFNPRSIAFVGASEARGSFIGAAFDYLRQYNYTGSVYPVNPKREKVWGIPACKKISDIDTTVDQAIIAVEASLVPVVLTECGQRGIGNAVILSSGFSEVGDEKGLLLHERIRSIAETYKIRVGGPNCVGFISMKSGTVCHAGPMPRTMERGTLGFVSQSGMLSANFVFVGTNGGIGFMYVVSSGNEAVLEFHDYIRFMLQDPEVKVVGCLIEGIRNAGKFMETAKLAAQKEKPLLVLKLGKSGQGKQAAASHTGSMAGVYDVHKAAFKQAGVILVESIEQLVESVKLFSYRKPVKRGNVAIIGASGGVCGYLADRAEEAGLGLADFSPATRSRLEELIPSFGTVNNPLDMTGQVRTDDNVIPHICKAILGDDQIDILVYGIGLTESVVIPFITPGLVKCAFVGKEYTDKLVAFVSCNIQNFTPDIMEFVRSQQVPLLQGGGVGLKAIKHLIDYNRFIGRTRQAKPFPVSGGGPEIREKWRRFFSREEPAILEGEAKELLADYGIRVPRGCSVSTVQEAKSAASEIGYPVVLKIQSAKILHKTEAAGVKLNLRDENDLTEAFRDLEALAHEVGAHPHFLLEEMIKPGVEMILGMKRDAIFGPVLAVGAGGIFTELYRDIALRVLPLNREDAEEMVAEVRGSVLLHGFRGRAEADADALCEAILRLARLSADLYPFISQIDINPLVVLGKGQGVVALDALFIKEI